MAQTEFLNLPVEVLSLSPKVINLLIISAAKGFLSLIFCGQLGFVYDCEERLREVRNENWESYDFTLDAAVYVVAESGFDGATRYYERDSAGRVLKETLPSGKFKRYSYDKCGHVTEITHDYDQFEKHSYSYWTSGHIREAVNEYARVSFRYNSLGLPVEERCDEHLIERSYDKH